MPDKQTALARSIESIVGGDHLIEDPALKIDGLSPKLFARPESADELAACMRVCSEFRAAVAPAGKMTWLECGNPIRRVDLVLSVERMCRVIDHSPADLIATVEAGLTLSEFYATTLRERQWLPLDPPGFGSASLGAIAACNSSGALRLGFGTPRDYVIGLKLTHAEGTQSKSGGRVVKNVAGYDMNKLYVGSFGTLAIITEITFKLRPLPERSSTMQVSSKDRRSLFQLAGQVLASELQPASVVLTRRLSQSRPAMPLPDEALLIRFIDSSTPLAYQLDWLMRVISEDYTVKVLDDDEAERVWAQAADLDGHQIQVRLSLPLSAVPAEYEKVILAHSDCVATADIGTGIIRMAFDEDERIVVRELTQLRATAAAAGGTMAIEKAPVELRREVDAWGDVGSTSGLMRSLKARFDPQSILNPGKFVSGI